MGGVGLGDEGAELRYLWFWLFVPGTARARRFERCAILSIGAALATCCGEARGAA